jgi:hypothetical protein
MVIGLRLLLASHLPSGLGRITMYPFTLLLFYVKPRTIRLEKNMPHISQKHLKNMN